MGDNSVILLEPLHTSPKAVELVKNLYTYNSLDINENYSISFIYVFILVLVSQRWKIEKTNNLVSR